jgi:hypothetical protein
MVQVVTFLRSSPDIIIWDINGFEQHWEDQDSAVQHLQVAAVG